MPSCSYWFLKESCHACWLRDYIIWWRRDRCLFFPHMAQLCYIWYWWPYFLQSDHFGFLLCFYAMPSCWSSPGISSHKFFWCSSCCSCSILCVQLLSPCWIFLELNCTYYDSSTWRWRCLCSYLIASLNHILTVKMTGHDLHEYCITF